MNESTTNSKWDDDSDWRSDSRWDSDSDTESRDDRESRIDESRSAKILSLSFFLTQDLRTNLSISLRKRAEAFVSQLNRKIIMFKEKCWQMNNFKMRRSMKIKKIMKRNEITAILLVNLRVYEKLNCLMNNWASHSMNNSIVYEESFNSNKKSACIARSEQCDDRRSTFLLINSIKFRISYWSQAIINNKDERKRSITSNEQYQNVKKERA